MNDKLTDEERKFAEEHHNLIYSFLHKHCLDPEEYYDIAAIGYLQAVIEYYRKSLKYEYSFSTIAFRLMGFAYGKHIRNQMRLKRRGFVISCDAKQYPNRDIKAPYDPRKRGHTQFTKYAEEDVIAQFDQSVQKAGLSPTEVQGKLMIHQSNPTGVCNKCTLGIGKEGKSGIFDQLSKKYPNLEIHVTSDVIPNRNVTGKSSFIVKNGKYIDN